MVSLGHNVLNNTMHYFINPFHVGNGIFHVNEINIMATDALAPAIARSSAAITLTMWNGDVFIFFENAYSTKCHFSVTRNYKFTLVMYRFTFPKKNTGNSKYFQSDQEWYKMQINKQYVFSKQSRTTKVVSHMITKQKVIWLLLM